MPLQGGHVLVMLTAINIVNFMDRGITPGAPKEFSTFVNVSMGVPMEDTAVWTGAIFSSFVSFYSIASVTFGHLMLTQPPFRLLSVGLCIWVYALAGGGLAYFFPWTPFAFWWYLLHRAISGVGEAAFQCIVPPYIEDISPPGSKAMWLGIFYTAIPCGTAIGFVYGSLLAPSPPESIGWGWAYLLEGIVMAPCAVAIAWLPKPEAIMRRRAAAARARGQLLVPLARAAGDEGGAVSTDNSLTASPLESPAVSTTASINMPPGQLLPPAHCAGGLTDEKPQRAPPLQDVLQGAGLCEHHTFGSAPADGGGMRQCSCIGSRFGERTVGYQLGWLLTNPLCAHLSASAPLPSAPLRSAPPPLAQPAERTRAVPSTLARRYVLIILGYAAQTATVMGISTFGPNFVISLGLFEQEATVLLIAFYCS